MSPPAWQEDETGVTRRSSCYGLDSISPASPAVVALKQSQQPAIVTSDVAPYPIVALNDLWCEQCGYAPGDALGKSPKTLLQGPSTNSSSAKDFALTTAETGSAETTLINYTKAGKPFVHTFRSRRVGGHFLTEGSARPRAVPAIVFALLAVLLVAALLPHARALSFEEDDGLSLGDAPGRPLYLNRFAIPPQVDAAAVHLRKQGPGAVIFAATVVVGNLDLVFPQLRLIKGLKFLKFLA